ncbi:MAG: hypothetical protein QNJ97_03230 [Myxococcota bacterium]|nr:hypothetical protein [Myxococcota bacterium]
MFRYNNLRLLKCLVMYLFVIININLTTVDAFSQFDQPSTQAPAQESGFALEIHLGTNVMPGIAYATGVITSNIRGGFLAGYKTDSILLGMGIDFVRYSFFLDSGDDTAELSMTSLLAVPGIRVVLAQSRDRSVDLITALNAGFGFYNASSEGDPYTKHNDTSFLFSYDVGIGLRYWIHPQFALGGSSGFSGTLERKTRNADRSRVIHQMGVFAGLLLLGVF